MPPTCLFTKSCLSSRHLNQLSRINSAKLLTYMSGSVRLLQHPYVLMHLARQRPTLRSMFLDHSAAVGRILSMETPGLDQSLTMCCRIIIPLLPCRVKPLTHASSLFLADNIIRNESISNIPYIVKYHAS